MKLEQLIQKCKPIRIVGNPDIDIKGVEIDSRQIKQGMMFIAMRGTQVDGHSYISKAIEMGATAIACETLPGNLNEGVTYLQYESTEKVAGPIATQYYGNPSSRMKLVNTKQ